jgi:hypothetical protein
LISLAALALVAGCARYARWSGGRSYVPPVQALDRARGEGAKGPVVMLVPGSMIVSAFFDVMRQRLQVDGFTPVVYQPPDLFTGSLRDGAKGIGQAVDELRAAAGQDKILIVAECNGGVAARYYVEKLGGAAKVERFVSFVSAHNGTSYGSSMNLYQGVNDIKPGSDFMKEMARSRPPENGPLIFSIFLCSDEIMKPFTTSEIPGAVNIEVCDKDFDTRARKNKDHHVSNTAGQALICLYPIHLGGFWDEPFYRLIKACLTQAPESIKNFEGLNITVH